MSVRLLSSNVPVRHETLVRHDVFVAFRQLLFHPVSEIWLCLESSRERSPKKKIINTFPLTCTAPSRLFWCESYGDVSWRDFCLVSSIMELKGSSLLPLKVPEKPHLKNSTAMSLSRNHAPVTKHKPQTSLWVLSCQTFRSASLCRSKQASAHEWEVNPLSWLTLQLSQGGRH